MFIKWQRRKPLFNMSKSTLERWYGKPRILSKKEKLEMGFVFKMKMGYPEKFRTVASLSVIVIR